MALGVPKLRRTRAASRRTHVYDRHAAAAGQRPARARATAGGVGRRTTSDAGGGNVQRLDAASYADRRPGRRRTERISSGQAR